MAKLACRAVLLAGALTLVGCVTINIYFPAAAAEKAAAEAKAEENKPDAGAEGGAQP